MMEWIKNGLILLFGGIASTIVPLFISKSNTAKKDKTAKTEAEAELDLTEKMEEYATSTEHGFEIFDKVANAYGGKCSVMKEEWLLMKLENYAHRQAYTFDLEKWTQKVRTFIARTQEINSKK